MKLEALRRQVVKLPLTKDSKGQGMEARQWWPDENDELTERIGILILCLLIALMTIWPFLLLIR